MKINLKNIKIFFLACVATISLNTQAAQLNISKLRINFEQGQQSDFLHLTNTSEKDLESFELSLFKWSQVIENNEIKEVLVETENILISPKTSILQPNKERIVRLIINDLAQSQKDYSYRLIINQLPRKNIENNQNNTVSFLFKISLPVFVYSDKIKDITEMNIDKKIIDKNNKKYLYIKNNDNQHIQVKNLLLEDKEMVVNKYLLPGIFTEVELSEEFEKNTNFKIDTDKGLLSF